MPWVCNRFCRLSQAVRGPLGRAGAPHSRLHSVCFQRLVCETRGLCGLIPPHNLFINPNPFPSTLPIDSQSCLEREPRVSLARVPRWVRVCGLCSRAFAPRCWQGAHCVHLFLLQGTMHGVDKSKNLQDKKKPTSRSARAGLQFPVGRVHRLLKVSDKASIGSSGGVGRHATVPSTPASTTLSRLTLPLPSCPLQTRVTANGRVGATAAVYTAAILGEGLCGAGEVGGGLRKLRVVERPTAASRRARIPKTTWSSHDRPVAL